MTLNTAGTWGDVPVGDISVVHPASALGQFNFTIAANDSANIRHEIMGAGTLGAGVPDATITRDDWMILSTPIFSWFISSPDRDVTLEIQTNQTGTTGMSLFKTFLIKAGTVASTTVHRMDSLYVPGANALLILHNSSAVSTARVEGIVRMRAM